MEETIKVVVTLRKKDLPKFVDKFGIEEYHFKKGEITIDMTRLFDDAVEQLPSKSDSFSTTSETSSDTF